MARYVMTAVPLLALLACAPQVVDAVDAPVTGGGTAGGTAGSGGSIGVGASGGVGAGGSAGTPGNGGTVGDGGTIGDGGSGGASCAASQSLVHRYTFDGTGTVVADLAGGPSGNVIGATLTGNGAVTLAGRMTDQYVDLPNGILSVLDSATLEGWLTWSGGNAWQRIFDFGDDQTGIEGSQGAGATYLFLTPRVPDEGGALRVAYQRPSYRELRLDATRTLPIGTLTHVAVTFDAGSETLAVYIDGQLENALVMGDVPIRLSLLNDINNWLGRSQYAADQELAATMEEFRIYARALDATELAASFEAGPNPACLDTVQ
jgi:hypothetical protein